MKLVKWISSNRALPGVLVVAMALAAVVILWSCKKRLWSVGSHVDIPVALREGRYIAGFGDPDNYVGQVQMDLSTTSVNFVSTIAIDLRQSIKWKPLMNVTALAPSSQEMSELAASGLAGLARPGDVNDDYAIHASSIRTRRHIVFIWKHISMDCVFVVASGLGVIGLMSVWRSIVVQRRRDRHECTSCGYSLVGSADDVCPECGRTTLS